MNSIDTPQMKVVISKEQSMSVYQLWLPRHTPVMMGAVQVSKSAVRTTQPVLLDINKGRQIYSRQSQNPTHTDTEFTRTIVYDESPSGSWLLF
mmetsp:Transcript_55779/g.63108  ORF Transcript_55779/g.63108 Transcript_55779/m.63108 type:complete len:93 (+) Transcript_55779:93-371(+)